MPEFVKRALNNILLTMAVLLLFAVSLVFLAVKEPDSLSGTIYLQLIYRTMGPKAALPLYNGTLGMVHYKSLPAVSDRFLVRTLLDVNTGEEEQTAILNFYLERSGYGLSQYLLGHKREVARKILLRFESYDQNERFLALRLLEELETGRPLPPEKMNKIAELTLPKARLLLDRWHLEQETPRIALGDE